MRLLQGKEERLVNSSDSLHADTASHAFAPRSYTHDIEALSCDEVLIDGSALVAELRIRPEDLAKAIRADIKEKTRCCASVGMGESSTAK